MKAAAKKPLVFGAQVQAKQPAGTLTLPQLAAKLNVNLSSLRVRLWVHAAEVAADGHWLDKRQWRVTFSKKAAAAVAKLLVKYPIRAGRGAKKKK